MTFSICASMPSCKEADCRESATCAPAPQDAGVGAADAAEAGLAPIDGESQPPTLVRLDVDVVDIAGGDPITVFGENLEFATSCSVGGYNAIIVDKKLTSLTFTMPEMPVGISDVRVKSAAGTSNALSIESWSPASVSGVDAYFDSRKGVDSPVGSSVASWKDQSVNGVVVAQDVAVNRPFAAPNVFGRNPAVRFVPNRWLALSVPRVLENGRSVFAVVKWTSTRDVAPTYSAPANTLVNFQFGSTDGAFGVGGGALQYVNFDAAVTNRTFHSRGSGLNDGTARLVGWTHSKADSALVAYVGTLQQGTSISIGYGTKASATNGWSQLGAAKGNIDGWDGDVAAIVIVDGVLVPMDLVKLHKWSRSSFGVAE
jgi:hypothetical protein